MKALRNVRWYVRRPDAGVERGTNVVESAVMVSLLFLVLLGILEAAMLMTNRSNVKSSVNLAVRSGSVAANDPDADYVILRDLGKLLGDQVPSVRYVIVFQANSVLAGQVPASCVASANTGGSGVAGLCNVYWPSVLRNPVQSQFGFDPITNATATADQSWPAVSRLHLSRWQPAEARLSTLRRV